MRVDVNPSGIGFQAKPAEAEMKLYTKTVSQGLEVLNKKIGMIIHNSSVPATPAQNTGIGSLLSETAEALFVPFLRTHGLSTIQQDPCSLRNGASPYSPLTTGKNIYMIPLEKLASKKYDNLISDKTFKSIVETSNKHSNESVDFGQVTKNYDIALREAYINYRIKSAKTEQSPVIKKLIAQFTNYKKENSKELESQAIYEILTKKYNTDLWRKWSPVDRDLYSTNTASIDRLKDLKNQYKEEIDFYMFKQMLAQIEIAETKKIGDKNGIKTIGDSPIAFTPYEEWKNKDLFIDGLALGCPPDYFAPGGQRWGFAVLKPETIFNKNGSLGKGGELLKQRYETMFAESSGGARIDHVIGLIDPFVYSVNEESMNERNSGRLYSSPNHPILGKYAKTKDEEYSAILEKIVFPAAKKFGLTKEDVICEDLGTITPPVKRVMDKLKLSGLSVTEFDYRGKDTAPEKIIMLGSHDNSSFIEYTDELFRSYWHLHEKAYKLAEDISYPHQNIGELKNQIVSDKKKFMSASFAELFTSPAKRIQVFFTDFFGIGKTYNKPGTTEGCWSLRLGDNFEKLYYENLKNGVALNLPEAIATAIRQKGEEFSSAYQKLLEKLDYFANVLKS
jgi:4-alpha-glucanotransferase